MRGEVSSNTTRNVTLGLFRTVTAISSLIRFQIARLSAHATYLRRLRRRDASGGRISRKMKRLSFWLKYAGVWGRAPINDHVRRKARRKMA